MKPILIDDLIKIVAERTRDAVLPTLQLYNPKISTVNYQSGHRLEIANTLKEWSKNSKDASKFPLIALLMDMDADSREEIEGNTYTLQIAIACLTEQNWKYTDRKELTLRPILYPIYDEFLRQIYYSGLFIDAKAPRHKPIERPLWGQQGANGNTGQFFDDKVDIIEIQNLRLTPYISVCDY